MIKNIDCLFENHRPNFPINKIPHFRKEIKIINQNSILGYPKDKTTNFNGEIGIIIDRYIPDGDSLLGDEYFAVYLGEEKGLKGAYDSSLHGGKFPDESCLWIKISGFIPLNFEKFNINDEDTRAITSQMETM